MSAIELLLIGVSVLGFLFAVGYCAVKIIGAVE